MLIVGGGTIVVVAVLLYLTYGGDFYRRRRQRRTHNVGFDHSLAHSTLPELRFRRPEPSDVDQIVALSREPATMAANRWGSEEADKHEAFLRSDRFETFANVSLVAVLRPSGATETGEIVGVGSLDLRPETSQPSIGVHVAAAHGERGFGTELMAAMILLTQHVSPGAVWVGTAVDNHAMQHVMGKLGYEPEDGFALFQGSDGSIVESLWYQVGTTAF